MTRVENKMYGKNTQAKNILKTQLNNGNWVLAKYYQGHLTALTYANRTQALRALEKIGEGWFIYHPGVPFYIAKEVAV